MSAYKMEDGTVVDTANAKQHWEEATYHDGRNLISKATGDQWLHQDLYRSRKGRYYLVHSSQWQGSKDHAEWISKRTAAAWLLANEHEVPADLTEEAAEVSE